MVLSILASPPLPALQAPCLSFPIRKSDIDTFGRIRPSRSPPNPPACRIPAQGPHWVPSPPSLGNSLPHCQPQTSCISAPRAPPLLHDPTTWTRPFPFPAPSPKLQQDGAPPVDPRPGDPMQLLPGPLPIIPGVSPARESSSSRVRGCQQGAGFMGRGLWLGEQEDRWGFGGSPMNARDSAGTYGGHPTPRQGQLSGAGDGARPGDRRWGQQRPLAGDSLWWGAWGGGPTAG